MVGPEYERGAKSSDRVGFAVRPGKRKPEVVAKFRFVWRRRYGFLQQRQRGGELVALVMDYAEEMLCQGVIGLDCEDIAIQRLCAVAVALLMHGECLLELLELLKLCGLRRRVRARVGSERAMTVLEPLAAAARAGIVATHRRHRRRILRRRGESRGGVDMARNFIEYAAKDCGSRFPLTHRHAVAAQLQELRRARDRGREGRDELCELIGWNDSAEIEQSVKPEGLADRIRGLERKGVGRRFGRESYAVLAFEQRPIRAADRLVLGLCENDARILKRKQQFARAKRESTVANAHSVVMPEPLRADVVATEELFAPGGGIDHVAIPLDQQNMRGIDPRRKRLQHEL